MEEQLISFETAKLTKDELVLILMAVNDLRNDRVRRLKYEELSDHEKHFFTKERDKAKKILVKFGAWEF